MIKKLVYGIPKVNSEAVIKQRVRKSVSSDYSDLFQDVAIEKAQDNGKPFLVLKRKHIMDGYFFGFGDKVGPMDRKGRKYIFWNTDNFTHHPTSDPLYKSFPFFIFVSKDLKKMYGCFTDYPGYMEIDLNSKNDGILTFKVLGEGFNQYIIEGKSIHEIVKEYLELTGDNIAFPIWAFGYQQSRWSYFNENEVFDIAKNFREKKIPCDVIYLDIDYMEKYKVFTWSKENFPNYKNMLEKLHKDGFKVVSILDPGVKVEKDYFAFEEGKDKYFLKGKDRKDLEGAVWPGRVRFPDFRNAEVRRWWAKNAKKYLDDGIDGFWNDMNEIAIFATEGDLEEARERLRNAKLEDGINLAGTLGSIGEIGRRGHGDDIVHLDGIEHWKVKNTYGFNMQRATSEMLQQENRRPFLITRSAYSGIQRYGGVWTGDNHSWWEHILQETVRLNSLSLCGVFYSGCDVGGFGGDVNAELLIRFMQLGLFTPMFRNHSAIGTARQEPWQFGPEVEELLKNVIRWRYKLLPYIYTQYMLGILNRKPLIRPMFLDYAREEAFNLEDQFIFGDSIIVAPIYRPNTQKRLVWLPKKAINIFNGNVHKAGWNIVETPIEHIPAFQIVNTAVPTMEPTEYVDMPKVKKISWRVFRTNQKSKVYGYFYEDDGKTLDYLKGDYNLKKVTIEDDTVTIETLNDGYKTMEREWEFEVVDARGNIKILKAVVGSSGEFKAK
ncbi:TIM-barrel domain-containing protein [Fervidobacterium gondwanense]|uniref:TIM-barrel domain-containing protein n=1 Tax=Fervidobacterium gondwanense TaxID=44754 RepID=UPI003C731547